MTPCAWRRSPNGSRDPVGRSPARKSPTSVSSLSASDTAAHAVAPAPSAAAVGPRVGLNRRRQVVVVDGLPDGLGLARLARVDAAHRALELGELAHHVGGEVCLRQPGRASGRLRQRPADRGPSPPSSRASFSIRSVFCRYEPRCLWKSTVSRRGKPPLEADATVGVPEEPRVTQARRDHALGVGADRAIVRGLRIRDREERRHQRAGLRDDREEILMVNQRRGQDFFGKLEELRAERARHDRRKLDEVRHFVEQRLGLRAALHHRAPANAAGLRFEVAQDPIAPIDPREQDEVLGELLPGTRRSVRTLMARPARPLVARNRWP